jgi:hypothetical protein
MCVHAHLHATTCYSHVHINTQTLPAAMIAEKLAEAKKLQVEGDGGLGASGNVQKVCVGECVV